jgi:inositol-phosphate phosphatase / L-galactose 1-phosphate phosphatase / histidinol-phosphatase
MSTELAEITLFANKLADTARELGRKYFRSTTGFERKSDRSPVTIADRAIEAALRQEIAAVFPDHAIRGEEMGLTNPGTRMWVIDPIDGTLSFVTGTPSFGTLIAYVEGDVPIVGVIELPIPGERWVGGGGETRMNGTPARVSGCTELSEARISTSGIDYYQADEWARYDALSRQAALRRFGGECSQWGFLASGFLDVVSDGDMHAHDYLAHVPVIEGAGGVITDWQGRKLTPSYYGPVVGSASAKLHDQVLQALNG